MKTQKLKAAEPGFAEIPFGIIFDTRLTPGARMMPCALLYWAVSHDECVVSNRELAEYLSTSKSTVERSLKELRALGYIENKEVPTCRINPAGRVIRLLWRTNPSLVPAPPSRTSI